MVDFDEELIVRGLVQAKERETVAPIAYPAISNLRG